jgi:hypothetical protein
MSIEITSSSTQRKISVFSVGYEVNFIARASES